VPRFQRPYSWDTSNVEDFWDDLTESPGEYFIGSMVVFDSGDELGLVDGQQRLTTATMILAAIRNELDSLGEEALADGIQTLVERTNPKGALRFVLQTETSYPFLQATIQSKPGLAQVSPPTRAEERDLAQAFELISALTRSISEAATRNQSVSENVQHQQAVKDLESLRDKVYGLKVVLVEVGEEDDATTIFQTLNSRGKDLEPADLVKAHLLQMLKPPNTDLDQARDAWDGMLRSFDESAALIDPNKFLLHAWLSRQEYVGEKDLFKKIKKKVRSNNAQEYLDALLADSERYRAAQEPAYRKWKKPQLEAARSLSALTLFRVQQPLPFILSVLREYDAKTIKLAALLRALKGVECFHFVATAIASQPSSGGVSRMYAHAAREVLRAKTPSDKGEAIDQLLQKLRDRLPTYPEFEAAFVELRSSRLFTQQTPLVRYVLEKLHATAPGHVESVPLDLEQLTVEHLVPQSGKGAAANIESARIGNLILVTEPLNQLLGDKSFSDKQEVLKSVTGVESEILTSPSWGKPQIQARSKRLAKRAYEDVWAF
jgi:hypothetical protein